MVMRSTYSQQQLLLVVIELLSPRHITLDDLFPQHDRLRLHLRPQQRVQPDPHPTQTTAAAVVNGPALAAL